MKMPSLFLFPHGSNMYSKTTHSITVSVEPSFRAEQSEPAEDRYVWAYHITIHNTGQETIRLVSRHWKITDGNGHVQEVNGEGVVGEQPSLAPGETFEYTSGAPLPTPGGIMAGTYRMERGNGEMITVEIPAFSLDSPYQNSMVH